MWPVRTTLPRGRAAPRRSVRLSTATLEAAAASTCRSYHTLLRCTALVCAESTTELGCLEQLRRGRACCRAQAGALLASAERNCAGCLLQVAFKPQ